MPSRCDDRAGTVVLLLALGVLGAGACEREARRFREAPPTAAEVAAAASAGQNPYEENAWAVSEGQRFYEAYNCGGCHARGGGGMGPALMDSAWIYGSSPAQVAASIAYGRPNGMPPFRDRIPEVQVWQLVAYVRALGGLVPTVVMSSRPDHMQHREEPAAGQ
jgi:cytochrome c oxidase cbb3-type subunit 3